MSNARKLEVIPVLAMTIELQSSSTQVNGGKKTKQYSLGDGD